jgi:hypothetical protein
VQLDPVDGEGAPPDPSGARRRAPPAPEDCLTWRGWRTASSVESTISASRARRGVPRQDGAPQGLQEAPQPQQSAVQRGGPKPDQAREQASEEFFGVAQEGAARLDAPKLLEEREGEDLRIREALEGLVARRPLGLRLR